MQWQQRGAPERGREGGTREREEGAKEVARAADGKAAGAWVIGGRDGRGHAMEDGCDGRWKGLALWRRGKTLTKCTIIYYITTRRGAAYPHLAFFFSSSGNFNDFQIQVAVSASPRLQK
jgi:hypothetical protein